MRRNDGLLTLLRHSVANTQYMTVPSAFSQVLVWQFLQSPDGVSDLQVREFLSQISCSYSSCSFTKVYLPEI